MRPFRLAVQVRRDGKVAKLDAIALKTQGVVAGNELFGRELNGVHDSRTL